MDDTLLRIFIAVTTFAVVIQAGILVGLYLAVRKSTAKMEALAKEVKEKAIPTIETVQSIITEVRPKIDTMRTNVSESSTLVKQPTRAPRRHAHRRPRPHASAGHPRRRTAESHHGQSGRDQRNGPQNRDLTAAPGQRRDDRHHTGVEVFLGQKRRQRGKNGMGVPQDEMFI